MSEFLNPTKAIEKAPIFPEIEIIQEGSLVITHTKIRVTRKDKVYLIYNSVSKVCTEEVKWSKATDCIKELVEKSYIAQQLFKEEKSYLDNDQTPEKIRVLKKYQPNKLPAFIFPDALDIDDALESIQKVDRQAFEKGMEWAINKIKINNGLC